MVHRHHQHLCFSQLNSSNHSKIPKVPNLKTNSHRASLLPLTELPAPDPKQRQHLFKVQRKQREVPQSKPSQALRASRADLRGAP